MRPKHDTCIKTRSLFPSHCTGHHFIVVVYSMVQYRNSPRRGGNALSSREQYSNPGVRISFNKAAHTAKLCLGDERHARRALKRASCRLPLSASKYRHRH